MDNQLQTLLDENARLKVEIECLKKENEDITTRLKKYTTNPSYKNYYNQNKDAVQETQKRYIDKMKLEDPERYKQYRKEANQRYREKQKINKQNIQNDNKIEEE